MNSRIVGVINNIELGKASNGSLFYKIFVQTVTENNITEDKILYAWENNRTLWAQLGINKIERKIYF
jgi:hypothetical protein